MKSLKTTLAAACFAVLAACGNSSGVVQDLSLPEGSTFVKVQGLSTRGVDSVRIVARSPSSTVTQSLQYTKETGDFGGYLVLAPDTYEVTATALTGGVDAGVRFDAGVSDGGASGTVVGTGNARVTVAPGATASVSINIFDVTRNSGQRDIAPIITALTASKMRVSPNEVVQLSATAVDLDGDAISYAWSDDCNGVFGSASRETTTWSRSTTGGCNVRLTVSARAATSTATTSLVVISLADGTVNVNGQFIPRPQISYVSVSASWDGGSVYTTLYPYYSQANVWGVPQGTALYINAYWNSSAFPLAMQIFSPCDGTPGATDAYSTYGYGSWTQLPSSLDGGAAACKLTVHLENQQYPEMSDDFSFGVELR